MSPQLYRLFYLFENIMEPKRLPRILIVGPLNGQQRLLEQMLQDRADMRFVSSAQGAKLVGSMGRKCDKCILWVSYVSHSHFQVVKNTFASENIKFVTGGVDKLKAQIEELCS